MSKTVRLVRGAATVIRVLPDIASSIWGALELDVLTPNTLTARVDIGAVTLEGEIQWARIRTAIVT